MRNRNLRIVFGFALLLGAGSAQAQSASPALFAGPPSPALPSKPVEPHLRVILSQTVYRIRIDRKTGAPVMPANVKAFAEPVHWPADVPKPSLFTWRVLLNWDFAPFPTRHRIGERLFTRPSPFKIDLKDEIRGGTLKVFAKAMLNGREVFGQAQAVVLGDNPPREVILKAFPRSRLGLLASKIAMAESSFRQFSTGKDGTPEGLPLLSRSNDVGLMQLNPPSGGLTSADQVWDWRANVQRGLEMFVGKRQISFLASRHASGRGWIRGPDDGLLALGCINAARYLLGLDCLKPPTIPPLSQAPGSGLRPGEADPDRLAISQIEREAIRRYNGGREYEFVVVPDFHTLGVAAMGWQIDPERGGVSPQSGDPNYVARVLAARSGLVLPPPPKPAKTKR